MEFRILGPLEVLDDGRRVDLGGAKQRAVLAVLLLTPNQVVSTDRLVDALWDDDPPEQARKTLQVYVSQLRKAIGKDRIETRTPGYVIRVREHELDLERARQLAAEGEHGQALAQFRGRPLAEFEEERFATADAARLQELRLAYLEDRIAGDLDAGRHQALVGELEALVDEYPVRERLRELLLLALYRSGRQAEALEVFQDARRALVDELGIEPSRSLRELHQAILRQDPDLDLPRRNDPMREPVPERPDPTPPIAGARSERKTVTVIHVRVDVESVKGMPLDAELLGRVLTRAVAAITDAVEGHEGTVEAVTGDAVTAVFGLPVVHEDDALRAAKTAEDVRSRLLDLGDELEADAAVRLHVRIGVSTGEVMTGGSGTHLRATGQPLTDAARLAHSAEPQSVALDETTQRAIAGRRDGGRFASPMVGRARERRRLHDAFEQAATDRSCQLFTILGVAGVGKSRLVQEFLGDVSGRALVARGRCLPYGEGITFWPVLEAVKDLAGVEDTESADEASARVASLIEDEPDTEGVALRVTELIGLREGSAGLEEGFSAVRTFFELLGAQAPLVVVFDDVHWGEETFLDLVEHLADWSRGAPLLLLCMARPELLDVRPSWGGGKLNATSVLLEPLSDEESAELVGNLVGEATLAEEVQERIASAAEGNPLFVEEVLSMLMDEGLLVRDDGRWTAVRDLATFPVPPTIQALLAARLDQLGAEERTALEAAAVEGKVFHERSVAELWDRGDPAHALASLVRKELIRPERPVFAGERAFRFRHLMIRDATYDAIPKERRAVLRERHVEWLEERTGERSVEFDEIVGYHLEQAVLYRTELGRVDERTLELGRRAAERLGAAARRALLRTDVPAGLNLGSRAAALLPPSDPLRLALVPSLRAIQGLPEAQLDWADRILTDAVEAAATTGDRRLAAHALVQRGLLRLFSGADVTGQDLLQTAHQAIAAFEELADELGLARAWRLAGQAHYLERRADESTAAAERALRHARRAGDRFEEAEILEWLVVTLLFGPRPVGEACELCEAFLHEVEGRPELEAMVAAALAWLEASRGRATDARRYAARARNIGGEDASGVFGFVVFSIVFALLLLDDRAEAEEMLRSGYDALRDVGRGGHYGAGALLLANLSYEEGRYDDVVLYVEEAARHSRPNDVWNRSHDLGVRAKLLAREGDFDGAEALARDAVAFAMSGDFVLAQVDALTDLAEVHRLAGRYDEAVDAVAHAVELHERRGNVTGASAGRRLIEDLRREERTQQRGRA